MSLIIKPQLLQDWAHLSLRDRAEVVEAEIGVKVTAS
jgi:hypothetical protein